MPSDGSSEKIKETVLLSLLHVALPTIDVYTDLALIVRFYTGSRVNPYCDEKYQDWQDKELRINCYYNDSVPTTNLIYTPQTKWGTMMLLPFLLNYLICWYHWATIDKRKAFTWVATLLSFYPQYVASKIICQIWTDKTGKCRQNKRKLERDLIQFETFWEAIPSTMVLTYLMVRSTSTRLGEVGDEIIREQGELLFFVTFTTSIISCSLGLAKNLKVGPCWILPERTEDKPRRISLAKFILIFVIGLTLGVDLVEAIDPTCGDGLGESAAIALSTLYHPLPPFSYHFLPFPPFSSLFLPFPPFST